MDTAQKPLIILTLMNALIWLTRTALGVAIAGFACLPLAAHAHEADAEEIALGSLVDAEFAFARMALEQGIRAAFLANFAPDGVVFEPAPVRLQETWGARPAPADPKALRLEWQPAQAGVAKSLDMGYTTGPSKLTDTTREGRVKHGVFFSVWQRDAGGVWRVVLDVGIATPEPVDFVALGAAPRPKFTGTADAAAQRKSLLARETRPLSTAGAAAAAGTYADVLAPDARLHRDGMAPLVGRAAIARNVGSRAARIVWSPQELRVARSGDMAMSYGKYREKARSGKAQEGYYAHVWLRDAGGAWRLAYDIALPSQ